jgi:hypothetical protein
MIPTIVVLILAGSLMILYIKPFLFWKKKELSEPKYVPWFEVLSGKIINRKKLQELTQKFRYKIPECHNCFIAALNRPDLPKGTIIDPNVERNTIIVLIGSKIIFVCKRCKTQIEEHILL